MGPQHVRCGMPDSSRTYQIQLTSFNGAATCSLRNAVQRDGNAHGCDFLQWGRNMFVAECELAVELKYLETDPSMGPQHVRCGMPSLRPACRPSLTPFNGAATCSLRNARRTATCDRRRCPFNGAATCSLRNDRPPRDAARVVPPSMGPQHVRCGMQHDDHRPRGEHPPSMGPQHVRCGMLPSRGGTTADGAAFNGAATCSLRNVLATMKELQQEQAFNGAATCSLRNVWHEFGLRPDVLPSMGPQHVRCGMSTSGILSRSITASFNGAATCSLRNVPYHAPNHVLPDILQWGRNMFVAECSTSTTRTATETLTFNGAATCSLRNAKVNQKQPICAVFLQWGRNMFVAECVLGAVRVAVLGGPSMGPQHVRCGMFIAPSARIYHTLPSMGPQHVRCGMPASRRGSTHIFNLQWGRNMFVAE